MGRISPSRSHWIRTTGHVVLIRLQHGQVLCRVKPGTYGHQDWSVTLQRPLCVVYLLLLVYWLPSSVTTIHNPPHTWLCLIAPPIQPDCWTLSYCRFKSVALIVMCRDVEELQSLLLALFTLQCCMLYAPAGSWFVLVCMQCKTATSSGEMTLCIASSLSRLRV